MTTFTARRVDNDNYMLFSGEDMIGICDVRYLNLLLAAPALLAAAQEPVDLVALRAAVGLAMGEHGNG